MPQIRVSADYGLGRVRPIAPPMVEHSAAEFGAGVAGAIQGVAQDVHDYARSEMEKERRLDEEAAVKADQARTLTRLALADDELREARDALSEEIRTGAMPADSAAAGKAWQARYRDIMTRAGEELPARTAEMGKAQIQAQAVRMFGSVRDSVRNKNRDDTKAGLMDFLELQEREAIKDRTSATVRAVEAIRNLGPAAGYGTDDQQRLAQGFVERSTLNSARAVVRGARDDLGDLDRAMQTINGPDFSNLSPDALGQLETQILNRKAQVTHQQEVQARRAEAAAERRMREAEHGTNALQAIIDGGRIPDERFLTDVQRKAAGTPYAAAVDSLVRQGADRAAFGSLTPQQQEAQLLRMRAEVQATGTNPALEKRLSRFQEIASANRAKAEKDPLAWGSDSGLIPGGVQPMQMGSLPQMAEVLQQRVDQAATVSAALGRPVSPLLASEAPRVADLLTMLPVDQRAAALRSLGVGIPPEQQRALAEQIGDKDKSLSIAMYLATMPRATGGADAVWLVLRGADAKKAGRIKDTDAVATADAARIARELDRVPWPTPLARDTAAQAAELAYLGMRDAKGGGSASWKEAIKATTGDLVDWNGGKVPAPPGWTDRRFLNAMRNTDAVSLAGQMRGAVFVNGKEVRPEALAKAIGAATLIPVGPGQYAIDVGGLVMTHQRRPFVYTVRD